MTGGIGSGKSEAKKAFRELSVPTIDLDDIAHQITQKNCSGYVEITKNFGNIYLDGNEEILITFEDILRSNKQKIAHRKNPFW